MANERYESSNDSETINDSNYPGTPGTSGTLDNVHCRENDNFVVGDCSGECSKEPRSMENFIINADIEDFIFINEVPAINSVNETVSTVAESVGYLPTAIAENVGLSQTDADSVDKEGQSTVREFIGPSGSFTIIEDEEGNQDSDYDPQNDRNSDSDDSELESQLDNDDGNEENHDIDSEKNESEFEAVTGRKRKKHRCENDAKRWKRNKNHRMRELGLEYYGKKKIDETWKYDIRKGKKKLKPPCFCKLSENENCKLKCRSILEEDRNTIFETFWKLTWAEKKIFIRTLTNVKATSRKRGIEVVSRRSTSTEFYLKHDGRQIRVCKKMFLQTLGLGEVAVKKWVRSSAVEKNLEEVKHRKDVEMENLNAFLEILPKLESHYCRASSTKLYLEPIWESKAQLFKEYKNGFCKENNVKPLSRATFSKRFDEMNLSLHRPKKDKCDVCVAFETQNLSELDYNNHLLLKEEARSEKAKDKLSDNEVFTMDLQSVLLCPKSNVSSLYYKTKLAVHNFTVYDVKRLQGYCYLWNESEGTLTSNEFSSIIINFLSKFVADHPSNNNEIEYILYSDGCNYQNRNTILSNALFNLAIQKNLIIIQKYLYKGHTQMEADSMHSTIERKIRKRNINVPADYVNICKIACEKSPYSVQYLDHTFFKNINQSVNFFSSIRPGRKTGDPVVTDIKALKYTRNGVFYKLRHSDVEWNELPVRMNPKAASVPFDSMVPLHNERIKIKKEKYQHLQQLKRSLEPDYHSFYDNLPHF